MISSDPAPPRVKVCGITTPADVQLATDAGADAIGVIADVPVETPREVSVAQAAALVDAVPAFATSVLVTMADGASDVLDVCDTVQPDAVQVHGDIPPGELDLIASAFTTIAVYDVQAIDDMRAAAERVDAILIDTIDEDGGGGTGRVHDWSLARSRVESLDVPVILAGGLHPGNVAAAIEAVGPYAVDVASGVARDDDPARKDPTAVCAFVRNARSTLEVPEP